MSKKIIYADDAIEALDAVCDRECEYSKQQRSVMCGACRLGSAFDVIEQLPSTQTEIIHCKDCEHYQTDWEPHYCDIMDYMMKEDDFCSKAKKKQMPKRLIFLEDAIKALEALFVKQIKQFDYDSYENADDKTRLVCDGISDSIGCVLNLPSAQPEIIRCRDCKHYHYANRVPQEQMCTCEIDGNIWSPDSYCSFAERKEDE